MNNIYDNYNLPIDFSATQLKNIIVNEIQVLEKTGAWTLSNIISKLASASKYNNYPSYAPDSKLNDSQNYFETRDNNYYKDNTITNNEYTPIAKNDNWKSLNEAGNTDNSFGDKIDIIKFLPTKFYKFSNSAQTFETDELTLVICNIKVGKTNDVIRTRLINETGTIKEVWAEDDYAVTLEGVLIGNLGGIAKTSNLANKPVNEIKKLIKIGNANVPIKISSAYLDLFGIKYLQIMNYELSNETEFKNIQRFTMNCYSDDIKLTIGI